MKRHLLNKMAVLSMAALLALSTGCGSSGNYATKESAPSYAMEEAAGASDGLYDYYDEEAVEYDESGSNTASSATEVTEEDASSNKSKRKLITNLDLNVETREFDALITFLRNKTEELGGYVESENITNRSYNSTSARYGSMTLRIPESKLDGFMSALSEKSNITNQNKSVKDVTLTYADLEGHKKALLAEQEQLLALMERADTIEDILQIQSQLSDVQYQLESMESQLRTFDNQITYSTVVMNIDEVVEYTPDAPPTFGERARDGFIENWNNVVDFFKELVLAIITHIPVLVVLIIIIVIVVIIVKVLDKKAKKRRAERMKNMPPYPQPGMVYPNMPVNPQATPDASKAQGAPTDAGKAQQAPNDAGKTQ